MPDKKALMYDFHRPHISDFTELDIDISVSFCRTMHSALHKIPINKMAAYTARLQEILCPASVFLWFWYFSTRYRML